MASDLTIADRIRTELAKRLKQDVESDPAAAFIAAGSSSGFS